MQWRSKEEASRGIYLGRRFWGYINTLCSKIISGFKQKYRRSVGAQPPNHRWLPAALP